LAYSRLDPSPRYIEPLKLYKQMHDDGDAGNDLGADRPFAGMRGRDNMMFIEG